MYISLLNIGTGIFRNRSFSIDILELYYGGCMSRSFLSFRYTKYWIVLMILFIRFDFKLKGFNENYS